MGASHNISFAVAFSAGFLSFVSPCVFPLIPSYVSYITGISFEDLVEGGDDRKFTKVCFFNSLAFIAGFTLVFMALGASSSFIGALLRDFQHIIMKVGGVLIIFFGLFIMGVIKLDFINRDKKFHMPEKPAGYIGSVIVGMIFAAGWTPCIGPILGSILSLAATEGSLTFGIQLLFVYSIGLGIPFLITSMALNTFLHHMPKVTRHMKVITTFSGLILIAVGLLLITDRFTDLSNWFQSMGLGWDIDIKKMLEK
ncbi:MAG: sulfite exporter TauE/SafE family protein [Proteobacteria bacterium]|nr:sulfite exporter TauE/SafE family protein [Pseudomonadota bacterium]